MITIQTKFTAKEKKRSINLTSGAPSWSLSMKYPTDGWERSLESMLSFTGADMNQHVSNSGTKASNTDYHSTPTNLKRAKNIFRRPVLEAHTDNQ